MNLWQFHVLRARGVKIADVVRQIGVGAPLEEGAIGCAVFDHGVYGARHLCRDCGVGFTAKTASGK